MDTAGSPARPLAAQALPLAPPVLRTLAQLPGPKGLPLLGNTRQIDSLRFHLTLENWGRQFGPFYRFSMAGRPFVVVSDSAVIATLLRDRPEALRRSSRTAQIMDESGVCGLFTAEGEAWRRQRKLVMRALTPEVVHNFFPTLVSLTKRLQRRWQGAVAAGKPVNLLRDLKAYTLDVTVALAMGHDINTLEHEDNPLQRDIEFIFNRIARRLTSPFAYWRYLKLPVDRAADASCAGILKSVSGFIAQARQRLDEQPALRLKPSNMLEALIVARDEPDSELTDDAVVGNAITMVFAGEDTTSNSIAWLVNFLLDHPEAAAKVAAEADAVTGGAQVLQDFHRLDHLAYLDAAAREAMRLKPVAPILGLETRRDMAIADVLVPAGTIVLCLTRHAAERSSELVQAQEFRPERWLSQPPAQAGSDPARTLFPFGGGPRFCPGRYLAMAEIKMVLVMMARNFELARLDNAPPVEEKFTFTMTPGTLPVRLRLRASY